MNADAFRHLYEYHFAENHRLWEYVMSVSAGQFVQPLGYSHGSVREQVVHLMDVDEVWFSDLRRVQPPDVAEADGQDDRQALRTRWDGIEQGMRAYLAGLGDDMLFEKPFPPGEDENLILWQVLIHVVNHGTDHRAQLLRQLNDLGVPTQWQDYVFYAYGHPVS